MRIIMLSIFLAAMTSSLQGMEFKVKHPDFIRAEPAPSQGVFHLYLKDFQMANGINVASMLTMRIVIQGTAENAWAEQQKALSALYRPHFGEVTWATEGAFKVANLTKGDKPIGKVVIRQISKKHHYFVIDEALGEPPSYTKFKREFMAAMDIED